MEHSIELNELAKALVAVQAVVEGAKKDSANPFFKSKYADLESVWGVCRPPLTEHGFAVVQTTEPHEHGVILVTTLLHTSGQWMRGRLLMRPVKDDPQGIGSCITYARRYALAAIVGVVQVDDDGEGASGRGEKGSGSKLEPPKRLERPAERPPAAAPLALTGSDDPLITDTERRKLFAMFKEYAIDTEAFRAFVWQRFEIKSRAEIRSGMLAVIHEWIKAQGKAVA